MIFKYSRLPYWFTEILLGRHQNREEDEKHHSDLGHGNSLYSDLGHGTNLYSDLGYGTSLYTVVNRGNTAAVMQV
jgi:hypothetical protein